MNCWTDYNQDTCDNAHFETALHVLSNSAANSEAWKPSSINFGEGHMAKESYALNDNRSNLYTMEYQYHYDQVSSPESTVPTLGYIHLDQSTHPTDWETHISQNTLPLSHMNTERLNHNSPERHAKQWSQDLDNFPGSGALEPSPYKLSRFVSSYTQSESMGEVVSPSSTLVSRDASLSADNTLSASPYPYSFQSNSQSQSQTPYTLQSPPPVPPTVPAHTPYTSFTGSPYIPPVNNSTPISYTQLPSAPYPAHDVRESGQVAQDPAHPQPSERTSTSLYPCSPIVPSKVHPTPPELSSSSSVQPSLPAPTTSLDNAPSAPIPSRTSPHRVASTKKRTRSSTKAVIVGTHAFLATASQQNTTVNQRHVPIRSMAILDEYFTRPEWRCRLCQSATQFKKEGRALEHLVSHHMFQEVKNIKIYDKNLFDSGEDINDGRPKRLIITKAQFDYARSWVEVVKCGKCLKTETSLFYRNNAINGHLKRHKNLKDPEKKEEMDRLAGLAPKSWEGYRNFNDKVLFNLPL